MKTKNTSSIITTTTKQSRINNFSCHSDHSGGIPFNQIVGNDISRNNNTRHSELDSESSSFLKPKAFGFTLVELIVVITILVILGTIAFTSISGFSGSARDSSRVSDLTNLSKALDIVYQKTGSYPTPDNAFTVTYSGGTLWTQGNIGDTTLNFINAGGGMKMSKKPVDPLATSKEYTYSNLAFGNGYQLKSDWEGDSVAFTFPQVSAASGNPTLTYVKGNYNGMVAKTETGSMVYVIALPSLFLNGATNTVSLPSTATGFYLQGQTNSGGVLFTGALVYSGVTLPSDDTASGITNMTLAIRNAYSGSSVVKSSSTIQNLLSISGSLNIISLGSAIITNYLGGSFLKSSIITYASCTLSGETISHGQNITAYTGATIVWNASYDCPNISQVRTCNNGTLSGDSTYQYTGCVKGVVNNCSASGSFLKNGHTYSIPSLNHSSGATNIFSTNITQNHGTFRYTLSNIECNDGNYINVNENATPSIVSCDGGYGINGNTCSLSQVGLCNTSVALGCTTGNAIGDNGQASCETTRTWYCQGLYGGGNSVQCSKPNVACPVNCVGSWVDNTVCSKICLGKKQQVYTVTVPAANGGGSCPYSNGAVQWGNTNCNPQITYTQATTNQTTIYSNISNYIGCPITDYPGGSAIIAGTTVGSKILVSSLSNDGVDKKWKTVDTTTIGTTSTTDGLTNTNAMATAGIALHPAGQICRNKGTQWYLPAWNELSLFYTNQISIGNFTPNCYWTSAELNASNATCNIFNELGRQGSNWKINGGSGNGCAVRCASRF